jgi:GrpB-like predicted nucleotidyltransferase (UPF0157 family)
VTPPDRRPVVVVPYDPAWPEWFERARTELGGALGGAAVTIEHVGSTSVPGLAAKPIVDIVIGVDTFARGRDVIEPVEALGYTYVPELESELPNRRYFRRYAREGEPVDYHVHMYEAGHPELLEYREFRDRLRADRELARAYEELKLELAVRFRDDRGAYTEGKEEFVRAALGVDRLAKRKSPKPSVSRPPSST